MTVVPPGQDPRFLQVQAEILDRAPEHSPQPSLDRVRSVLEILGDPQRSYPVVHVTGTNGKTSTARMVDRLLREHGLRTGRFTSPHLDHVGERITVDGLRLDDERFVAAWDDIAPYVQLVDERSQAEGGPRLSFFEVLTVMAFAVFADAPVDVAVVEVGLGGTWDSTNVADATVAVVTPVALDHERWLGHGLVAIAEQKAGIVKEGSVLVTAEQPLEVAEVLMRRSVETGSVVAREGIEFGVLSRDVAVGGQRLTLKGLVGGAEDVYLPLHGAHQARNAAVAAAAVEAFLGSGGHAGTGLDPDLVRDAFAHVDSPGRLEAVRRGPLVVVDAAHNPAGAAAAADGLREAFPGTRLVGVVGVMADKDAEAILEQLEPVLTEVVVTAPRSARAMPVDELADLAHGVFGEERVHVRPDLADAIDTALAAAETGSGGDDVAAGVVVTGSIFLVAEARAMLGAQAPDSLAVDTTSRGVSAVAEDTERRVLGEDADRLDHLDDELDELARLGVRDDLHDERDERPVVADPYAPPEDSALLDDPWVVREEHDDYWDRDDESDETDDGGGPARA
ncbi:bifunctional folylpolyglutamate synthase/dihydrofolate synthase [Aquipuribacter sp. MA13-6]|uniref:bifunctional folylpolyglutamate synthase/dihydrofolate synthase n=1 Tax=unclassified Aquipuribacter TaxID=2635084 RepID=UPI003EEB6842